MVKYNDNSIYIIGGFQDGSRSKETWIVNPKNGFEIVNGPKLNQERSSFSCGKMEVNDKILIVIAGGEDRYGFGLDSVEILDPQSNQGWKSGNIEMQCITKVMHFLNFHFFGEILNLFLWFLHFLVNSRIVSQMHILTELQTLNFNFTRK